MAATQTGTITLGTFKFDSQLFGDTLSDSDGGIFRNGNWLNITNSNPGTPGALTGPNFDTGIANIGLGGSSVIYTIGYNTPIVNGSGDDLGIVTARFSTNDTFQLAVSTDGTNFTSFVSFGPGLAVSTGVGASYFYAGGGPFSAVLFVTLVDLSVFNVASGASIRAVKITSSPEGDLIRVAGFAASCTANITSVTIQTNKNCDASVNPKCSANIVLADGSESTDLTTALQPAQAITLHLTTDFGTVNDVTTDATGTGISSFVSGTLPFGQTSTTTASIGAVCVKQFPNLEKVFNYNGFDFHESQVTNTEFVDSTAMDVAAIQRFLDDHGSFLAKFVLVGRIGGFIDSNGNGMLDAGEPTYSPSGTPPLPVHVHGISAATVIANVASGQGVNPKVLLATAEKENSLISNSTLPSTSVLNFAMGCATSSNFVDQMQCAGKTLIHRFNDTKAFGRTISYPFFFRASDKVQHNVTGLGRTPVGFAANTAATYAQYRYTPFIQALPDGGGVFRFEILWSRFGF
ncbi:MAG: hypothetical protein ACJ71U_15755 [Terriglobales bacterium]